MRDIQYGWVIIYDVWTKSNPDKDMPDYSGELIEDDLSEEVCQGIHDTIKKKIEKKS